MTAREVLCNALAWSVVLFVVALLVLVHGGPLLVRAWVGLLTALEGGA